MGGAAVLNKHQLKTEATKKKLLRAAERVFTRRGFEAACIEDIAAEAGHTRGAFYAHFKTKEDLFFAMFEDRVSRLFEELRATMDKSSDERQRMQLMRDFYVSRIGDQRWSILMLEFKLYAVRHGKRSLAERFRNLKDNLRLSFFGGLLQPGTQTTRLSRLALESLLDGLALQRAYDPGEISEDEASHILGMFFDTVMPVHSPLSPNA